MVGMMCVFLYVNVCSEVLGLLVPHGQTESGGVVLAVICWARARRGGVSRQGVVLTDLQPPSSLLIKLQSLSLPPCLEGGLGFSEGGDRSLRKKHVPLFFLKELDHVPPFFLREVLL
jgi:hypothetical protein